jgi:hypothetical protein
MSDTRTYLKKRKAELEAQLKPMYKIQADLHEVIKALNALDPEPTCTGCRGGCASCRTEDRIPYYSSCTSCHGDGCESCREGEYYR